MSEVELRNCPKCGSIPSCYREIGVIYTTWHIEDGGINLKEGEHGYGDIKKTQAVCSNLDCQHTWTLRGVLQIDEMIKE